MPTISVSIMLKPIDQWYEGQEEPARGCLTFLRKHILQIDPALAEAWKYRMPFFCYNGKMCCYLWYDRTRELPYIGFVEGKSLDHPDLLQEKRSRMKILLIDPGKSLPMKKIDLLLKQMLKLYKK